MNKPHFGICDVFLGENEYFLKQRAKLISLDNYFDGVFVERMNILMDKKRNEIMKPYPNYHAARIKAPESFLRVRVMQTTKEGIMIYGGPLKSDPKGPTKTQAVRFPKDKFSVKEAKAWLKEHDYEPILFEPASEEKKKAIWPTISKREIVSDDES